MSTYPEQSNGVLTAGLYKSSPRADPGEGDVAAASTALTRTTRMYAAPPQDESEVVASTTSHCAAEVKDPWSGSSVLGATVRTGNIDDAGVSEETSLSYDEDRWHHRAKAAGDYLRNRTEIQEQSSEGEYEVRYGLDSRRFTYGLARYEDDRLSGFDFEITSSAGLGRHLVREGGHEWTVTLGRSFRVAQPRDSESPEQCMGARFTNLVRWELPDSARVENETEALADGEEVRVNNDVARRCGWSNSCQRSSALASNTAAKPRTVRDTPTSPSGRPSFTNSRPCSSCVPVWEPQFMEALPDSRKVGPPDCTAGKPSLRPGTRRAPRRQYSGGTSWQ